MKIFHLKAYGMTEGQGKSSIAPSFLKRGYKFNFFSEKNGTRKNSITDKVNMFNSVKTRSQTQL